MVLHITWQVAWKIWPLFALPGTTKGRTIHDLGGASGREFVLSFIFPGQLTVEFFFPGQPAVEFFFPRQLADELFFPQQLAGELFFSYMGRW